MLVFGKLIATGDTDDIHILEIVEGWEGQRCVSFVGSPDFPLQGRLTVYFLTPAEFEHPTSDSLPGLEISPLTLLRQAEVAYAVVFERPDRYGFDAMRRFDTQAMSPRAFLILLS